MAILDPRSLFRVGRRTPVPARVLPAVAVVLMAICIVPALGYAPINAASGPGPDRDDYLVFYQLNRPCGYVRATRTTVVENGETLYYYRSEQEQHIGLPDSKEMLVRKVEEAYTDLDFRVRRFSFRRTSGPSELSVEGVVRDGKAHLTINTAGWPIERTVDFPADMYHTLTLEDLIVSKGLKPEQVISLTVFDLENLAPETARAVVVGDAQFEFGGKEIKTSGVFLEIMGFLQILSLDRDGHLYAVDTLGSYIKVRRAPNGKLPKLSASDLITDIAVFPSSVEIKDLAGLRSMAVKVEVPMVFSDFLYPVDERQEAHGQPNTPGDLMTINIETRPQAEPKGPTAKLPVEGGDEFGPYLAEDLEGLHRHPLVQRIAAEAVGSETDAWSAFLRIVDWVNANIPDSEEPYETTVPESLTPGGDFGLGAREKAIVALAKAAGIPVRRAVGYVYVEGAFLGISWLEVWAGKWISVDVNADTLLVTPAYVKITDSPTGAAFDPLYAIVRSSSIALEEYDTGAGVVARGKSSVTLDGVYINAEQRYQVEVPVQEGWEIHEELGRDGRPMAVITPPQPTRSEIVIQVLPVDAAGDAESPIPDKAELRLEKAAQGMSKFYADMRQDYKETSIGWQDFLGQRACVLSCEYKANGVRCRAEYYLFSVDDRMFVIEVSGPSEEFPELKEKFQVLMNGFYVAR